MTLIVTWLWQGVAIAWLTAAAIGFMPRLNAATRHVVWWLALAAVLAIPVAHLLAATTTGGPSTALTPLDVDTARTLLLPAIPGAVVVCAVAFWAMTAAAGVWRIARSWRVIERMKRASSPFDRSREARLPLWVAARGGGHRAAELRTSDRMAGACALGLGRPAILVSRSVAETLSDESLDEIVMHEQAHLDRYDDWSKLLLAVVCAFAWLHPAVRFLARRLDIDREAACDDRVVSSTGAARRYASSLLTVAAASDSAGRGADWTAAVPTATTSALRERVGRLLDPRRERGARIAGATSLTSVAGLTLAVVVSTYAGPVVVFHETASHAGGAAVAPLAIDAPLAQGTETVANVGIPAPSLERPAHRAPARSKSQAPSNPVEVAAQSFPLPTADEAEAPTAPLDSRVIAAVAAAPVTPLPSLQWTAAAVAPPAPPWQAVTTSATSAAEDVARTAAETGVRARSAGVSIGRFLTRVSKAGAGIF